MDNMWGWDEDYDVRHKRGLRETKVWGVKLLNTPPDAFRVSGHNM